MWYWQRYKRERGRMASRRKEHLRETILYVEKPRRVRQRERLHRVGSLALLAVVVAGAVWLGTAGLRRLGEVLFWSHERFTLKNLDLASNGKLQPGHIREYAKIEPGMNLFAINLRAVRRELESVPVVGSVTIQRILPDTLRIRISERTAVARLGDDTDGIPLAVDRDGYALGPSSVTARLPVITGHRLRGLRPGGRVEDPAVQTALQLLTLCDDPVFSRFVRISRVHIAGDETLDLKLERGESIRFPRRDLRPRLERLCEIIKQSADEGRAIASVDMTVDRNFPVRYR